MKLKNIGLFFTVIPTVIILTVILTKPKQVKEKIQYTYIKVKDWKHEKNPRKLAYYEHLYKN